MRRKALVRRRQRASAAWQVFTSCEPSCQSGRADRHAASGMPIHHPEYVTREPCQAEGRQLADWLTELWPHDEYTAMSTQMQRKDPPRGPANRREPRARPGHRVQVPTADTTPGPPCGPGEETA
jgi:hypothetical protein